MEGSTPNEREDIFIGLMSGTSMDGVDAAAVNFVDNKLCLIASLKLPYPSSIKEDLLKVTDVRKQFSLKHIACLDISIGNFFATTVQQLINEAQIASANIVAIGSHGQTISHNIDKKTPYSWQIGNPSNIAVKTGITTVASFRSADVALGGQGAPLVPAFHEYQFSSDKCHRVIVNIGGIANISILKTAASDLIGYDTGPGNCLMDDWCRLNGQGEFDEAGRWAQSGNTIVPLLDELLSGAYFKQTVAKSTGRELFNLHYLDKVLNTRKEWRNADARDVQATLVELTSRSVTEEIKKHQLELTSEIYICGGGASNRFLVKKIREEFPSQQVKTTDSLGIHPDFVEAAAFAWLAKQRLLGSPIKLVTGGKHNQLVLGGIYST